MVHYSFENVDSGIAVLVTAPDFDTALSCLSDSCKDFHYYSVDNISFDYVNSRPCPSDIIVEYKPLGLRLNNPLNIRYYKRNKWIGLKGEQDGFCIFFSPVHGFRAALRILCNYVKIGVNQISPIIHRFAPESENNTESYINFVCLKTSFTPYTCITTFAEVKKLCWAMCLFELGYKKLSETQLDVLISCLNIACANYKYPLS